MKLLIKFPTRGRRGKFFNTLNKYQSLLSGKNDVQFLISMDNNDPEMNDEAIKIILNRYDNLVYFYSDSDTKVEAVNRDINKISEWDIILLASDDMIPQINNYDEIIIENMKSKFPDTDGVLFFNDGYQKNNLNTLSILGKKYYDRFGYIYYPGYKSVWCDNEFTNVANILKKQEYFDMVIIKHEHPDWGYGKRDEIHFSNIVNHTSDYSLYLKRKELNYEL
jgi:hypothetical protein